MRLFVVIEELKRGWEEWVRLWDDFAGGPFARWGRKVFAQVPDGSWHRGERKGWEAALSHICRIKSNGWEKWLLQLFPERMWGRMLRKGVALVVSRTHDDACLCLTWDWHLQRFWSSVPSLWVKVQRLSYSGLCVTLQRKTYCCLQEFQPGYSCECWQWENYYWG